MTGSAAMMDEESQPRQPRSAPDPGESYPVETHRTLHRTMQQISPLQAVQITPTDCAPSIPGSPVSTDRRREPSSPVTPALPIAEPMHDREEILSQILESLTTYIWLITPAGQILEANAAARTIAQLPTPGALNHSLPEAPAWKQDPIAQAQLQAAIVQAGQGQRVAWEFVIQAPQGERILDFAVTPLYTAAGTLRHLLASGTDITPFKQTETQLRQREERWQLTLRGTHDGCWDWDVQTNQMVFSDRWKALRGYGSDELPETFDTWRNGIHPDDLQQVMQTVEAYLARKIPQYSLEYRVRRKDGTYLWIWDRGEALWNEAGQAVRMAGAETDITQRKQAETALQESQNKYQTLFQVFPIGISITDPAGQIIEANTASEQILGLSLPEHHRRTYDAVDWQIIRPDGFPMPPEEYASVRALQDNCFVGNVEMGILHPTGALHWISVSAAPIPLENYGVAIAYVDITERKQAETDLRKSQSLLALAQQVAHIGNWELDLQTQQIDWSEEIFRILGRDPQLGIPSAVQRHLLYHPDDRAFAQAQVQHTIDTGESFEFDARIVRPDGSLRYIAAKGQAMRDDQGQVVKLFGTTQDITDRKRTEEALQLTQARFAGILELASDAIICADEAQKIILFNQGAEKIFGYGAEEMIGQSLDRLFPHQCILTDPPSIGHFDQANGEAQPLEEQGEIWGQRQSGEVFPAEASLSRLSLHNETILTLIVRDISQRKQSEVARSQLAAIVESSQDAIISKNTGGIITSWNAAAERMFGYSAAEMIGQPIFRIVPPELQDEEAEILQSIQKGQSVINHESRRLCKDGSLIDVALTLSLLRNQDGQIMGASNILRDISDRKRSEAQRKQAEQALQESQERFRVFMNNAPVLAWLVTAEGQLVYANPTWLATYDRTPLNPIGQSLTDLFDPDTAQEYLQNNQRVLESGQVLEILESGRDQAGNPRSYLVRKFPIYREDHSLWIGGVAIDVTERQQAELALQQSESRLQLALEGSGDGFWDWNILTGDLYLSPRWCRMLGYAPPELPDHVSTWKRLMHPDDFATMQQQLQAHLADPSTPYQLDYRLRCKNGDWKWIANYGKVVVWDEQGHPIRMAGTHRDISDRKEAEAKLQQTKEQLELALQASHDGFWDWNLLTGEIYFSPRWKEMLGYADHELPNSFESWELVIFEEDRVAAMQLVEDYNSGKVDRFLTTQRFHHKNGSTVHVLSRAIHLKNAQGKVVRMIGSHSDITETVRIQEALRNSEMQLSGVLDSSLDGIMAFHALRNEAGKIIDFVWLLCNPAAAALAGQPSSQLIGKSMLREWPSHRYESLFDLCVQVVESGTPIQREFAEEEGDRCWQTIVVRLGEGCAVTFRDVSKIRQSEQALQQLNEELEARVRDLKGRNEEMQLLSEMSDFLQACLTFDEACAAITTLVEPLFPDCSGGVFMISSSRNRVENVATWGKTTSSELVFHPNRCWGLRRGRIHRVDRHRSGLRCNHIEPNPAIVETLCIPMIAQGETLGLLYLSAEHAEALSEAKQQLARTVAEQVALAIANLSLRETLQNQSIRDPLTGLFNRRYLDEFLSQEIHRSRRNQYEIGVIMLDIDHFKHFNDTFGHDAGDSVLQEVGKLLRTYSRGSDVACRYGGEEMTLIFPETSLEQAYSRAEAIRTAVSQLRLSYNGKLLGMLTVSLGVACFPHQGVTGDAILQAADAALYRAKAAGRNRVIVASE